MLHFSKTPLYISAGWRSEVKPETQNIKKAHTTLVEFFKTASSVDTLRYAAVNKDDAELLDNINNLGYEEVEAKTSQLKSRIENESKKIKNAMEEMKIVHDGVVDEKIPEVVVREIACLDVDSQFVEVGVDELLIGKGIKVQMV